VALQPRGHPLQRAQGSRRLQQHVRRLRFAAGALRGDAATGAAGVPGRPLRIVGQRSRGAGEAPADRKPVLVHAHYQLDVRRLHGLLPGAACGDAGGVGGGSHLPVFRDDRGVVLCDRGELLGGESDHDGEQGVVWLLHGVYRAAADPRCDRLFDLLQGTSAAAGAVAGAVCAGLGLVHAAGADGRLPARRAAAQVYR